MKTAMLALLGLGTALGVTGPALAQQPQAKSSAATPAPSAGAPDLKTAEQKTAYAIGMDISHQLKPIAAEYDPDLLAQGLRDGLAGKAALTDAQFLEVMQAFRTKMIAKQREMMAQQQGANAGAAAKNLKDGQAFLAANKTKPGVTALPSGVQYKVLKQGTGKTPKATDLVKANYRGTLLDGTEFDASAKHGGPLEFPVNGVIAGWTEVLQKMKVGDKFQVFIPGDKAYGPEGNPPDIGPNATLIFEIELVDVTSR